MRLFVLSDSPGRRPISCLFDFAGKWRDDFESYGIVRHFCRVCEIVGVTSRLHSLIARAGIRALSPDYGNHSPPLSQDSAADRAPPGRIDAPHVYREALTSDQCGQRIAIYLVHAPVHHKIAHHTECDQQVQAKVEEVMVEQEIKAANGCIHERAGSDEQKPAWNSGLVLQ